MSDIRIVFVVAKNFRGIFVVEEDVAASPVPRDGLGVLVYQIPPTGRLKTSSVEQFREWHKTEAVYVDGSPLGFEATGPIAPFRDRSTKVRPITSDSKGCFYFLVGSEAELARAMHNLINIQLGGVVTTPGDPEDLAAQ